MENISQAFKIILNADSHMEHVDTTNRKDFNYAVVSKSFIKAAEKNAFMEDLQRKTFIMKKEVFHYKTNPVRAQLINFIIKIKGMFVSDQLTPNADKRLPDMCNEENFQDLRPKVMINVIKLNQENKDDLDVYFKGVVLGLFPKIGSYIVEAGEAVSEYWSQVALMQYSSVSSLCRMAESEEYSRLVGYKISALDDTHTYLTQLIP